WIILFDGGGLPGRIEPLTDGKLRIGREQGDLRFAHDMLISSRHAELAWSDQRLTVHDLGSRNGVFVRLRPGEARVVRAGGGFRCGRQSFRAAPAGVPPSSVGTSGASETSAMDGATAETESLQLLHGTMRGDKPLSYLLEDADAVTIGRDPACAIAMPSDSFLSPRHAQIRKQGSDFLLEDLDSLNGVYIRLGAGEIVELQDGDMLRIGDQLLGVLIPSRA
ncbi:MAG: FHA domain-containing protein, partial [Planctomycetia bacterium]